MNNEKTEVFVAVKLNEIDDGKKDFILNLPKGGRIIIEEKAYAGMGFTYEQMKSTVLIPGAILAEIGLKILGGASVERT